MNLAYYFCILYFGGGVLDYVCVDVDGVLLDLQKGLSVWLNREYGITFNPEKLRYYNYSENALDFDVKLVYEVLNTPDFYTDLEFFPNALVALRGLQSIVPTKAYTGSVAVEEIGGIRRNLCETIGLVGEPFVGRNKVTDLGAVALFDDCFGVHKQWVADGSEATLFLIDAPYNRRCGLGDRLIRCSDFADAVNRFKVIYRG